MKNKKIKIILFSFIVITTVTLTWSIFKEKINIFKPIEPSYMEKNLDIVLKDQKGNDVKLLDYKDNNKLVIFYTWATWCPFCKTELQKLAEIQKKIKNSAVIIAVNRAEPLAISLPHARKQELKQLFFLFDPDDSFYKAINGFAMPELLIIGNDGNIKYQSKGPTNFDELIKTIKNPSGA